MLMKKYVQDKTVERITDELADEVIKDHASYEWFEEWFSNCFFDDLAPDLLQHVWDLMDKYEIQEDDTDPVAHDVVNEIQYKLIKRLCVQWEENYENYKALKNGGR
jgi:hypothetical protein|tara:strand:- start:1348 stop:1665 length:318 start_codon:yes stop_codon:yes gene_type:complete